MSENPPRRPTPSSPLRPTAPPPAPQGRGRLPEPPAFRTNPLAAARACSSCAAPIGGDVVPPRCWGCGRPLCTDCFWRHGLTPAMHRCTSCLIERTPGRAAISGGRAVATSGPGSVRIPMY